MFFSFLSLFFFYIFRKEEIREKKYKLCLETNVAEEDISGLLAYWAVRFIRTKVARFLFENHILFSSIYRSMSPPQHYLLEFLREEISTGARGCLNTDTERNKRSRVPSGLEMSFPERISMVRALAPRQQDKEERRWTVRKKDYFCRTEAEDTTGVERQRALQSPNGTVLLYNKGQLSCGANEAITI